MTTNDTPPFFKNSMWRTTLRCLFAMSLLPLAMLVQAKELNANYFYFFDGKPVGGWGLTLGDQGNWVLAVTDTSMNSADKQVAISRADYKSNGDAINLKWSRSKGKGQFAIYGSPIDLSKLENKVALTMEIKIIKKPKTSVTIGMDCGYPCRGELNIHQMLRDMKTDEWILFPIPLNCFSTKGADLSKVNSPFMIASEGQLELQIANIRLELLPEGAPTCAT
jgi:hypothetical protein